MDEPRTFDVDIGSSQEDLFLKKEKLQEEVELQCGATVLISASINGKEIGYVLATASAEFELVHFDPDAPNFYTQHFLFQVVCVTPPKKMGKKRIYAFRNQKFGVFISSSSIKQALIARKTLGDHECFDISSPEWRMYSRGLTKSTAISLKTMSQRKILRLVSSKTFGPLSFSLKTFEQKESGECLISPYSLPSEYEEIEELDPPDDNITCCSFRSHQPTATDSSQYQTTEGESFEDFTCLEQQQPTLTVSPEKKEHKKKNFLSPSNFTSLLGSSSSPTTPTIPPSNTPANTSTPPPPPSSPPCPSSVSTPMGGGGGGGGGGGWFGMKSKKKDDWEKGNTSLVKPKDEKDRQSEMGQAVTGFGDIVLSPFQSVREVEIPEDLLQNLTAGYEKWVQLSDFLVSKHFKKHHLPHTVEVEDHQNFYCPHFSDDSRIQKIEVLKRFNSRKQPHLIVIHLESGKSEKFIFKEDDNVAMDVVVMELMKRSNAAWEKKGLQLHHRTYTIVATHKKTGFLECVPGDTVLKFSMEDIVGVLQREEKKWHCLVHSILACMIMTAAFMITDRHHNNVMFTPDGDLCMIDLSASLGNKAPLDGVLHMNPVYLPKRIMRLCGAAMNLDISPALEEMDAIALEEILMAGYYALLRDESIVVLCKLFNWQLPNPLKFLGWVQNRIGGRPQAKEGFRNKIVKTMDENDSVNNAVAFITSLLPIN